MVATTQADVWGVRRELLPWMQYHTELGVTQFYVGDCVGDETARTAVQGAEPGVVQSQELQQESRW